VRRQNISNSPSIHGVLFANAVTISVYGTISEFQLIWEEWHIITQRLLTSDGLHGHLQRVFSYFKFSIEKGTAERQAIIR
jgi:hypothetical protein